MMLVKDLIAKLKKCPQDLPVEMEYEPVGEVVVLDDCVFIDSDPVNTQREREIGDGETAGS